MQKRLCERKECAKPEKRGILVLLIKSLFLFCFVTVKFVPYCRLLKCMMLTHGNLAKVPPHWAKPIYLQGWTEDYLGRGWLIHLSIWNWLMLLFRDDTMDPATLKTFKSETIKELYQPCAFPHSSILFLKTSQLTESQDASHHLSRVLGHKFLANQPLSTLPVFLSNTIFCCLSLKGLACHPIHTPSSADLLLNFLSAGLDALPLRYRTLVQAKPLN